MILSPYSLLYLHLHKKKDNNPIALLKLLSGILFKDQPDLVNLLGMLSNISPQTNHNNISTLNTEKVNIDDYTIIN